MIDRRTFLFTMMSVAATLTAQAQETPSTEILVSFPVNVAVADAAYEGNTEPPEAQETPAEVVASPKPRYWSLHTNALYDLLLVPNIGAEFYLGKDWSVAGNWWYSWWNSNHRHRYWRTYGGELAFRRWFGRLATEKPLTGHHLGLYAQLLTYDFELGGTGYMGGEPGDNIFEHPSYAFGVEYGFALPIGRRLNIDFNLGLGYLGGRYYEYRPIDGHYVWQRTKQRHWWGPTKAAVSLVWLLGRGNENARKGGKP